MIFRPFTCHAFSQDLEGGTTASLGYVIRLIMPRLCTLCINFYYDFDRVYLTGPLMEALSTAPCLTSLDIDVDNRDASDSMTTFEHISAIDNLRDLRISFSDETADISPLARCTGLRTLDFSNTRILPVHIALTGVLRVLEACPSLRLLYLPDVPPGMFSYLDMSNDVLSTSLDTLLFYESDGNDIHTICDSTHLPRLFPSLRHFDFRQLFFHSDATVQVRVLLICVNTGDCICILLHVPRSRNLVNQYVCTYCMCRGTRSS